MPRRQKLSDAAVRRIYASKNSAKELSTQYGVSVNTVYLIRQGRRRQDVTGASTARSVKPSTARGVKQGRQVRRPAERQVDINALADAVIDRLLKRLKKL